MASSNLEADYVDLDNESLFDEEDDTELHIVLPKLVEDLSLTNDSQIPVPNISFRSKLQHKDPERCQKKLLNLLHLKRAKPKKSFPKTRKEETNTTFPEKLTEVYLKGVRRNTLMKQKNFMKNNFLEELVMKEELPHLILEILPKNKCYYIIENVRVNTFIDKILFDDIQNWTLSDLFYQELRQLLIVYCIDINGFMVNNHIILNVKRYLSTATNAKPAFSSFILLKPTSMLLIKLTKSEADKNQSPNIPDLESLRKESKIISKSSGPLYLETSPLAKQFISFLKEHRHQLDFDIFKQYPVEEQKIQDIEINLPPVIEHMKELAVQIQNYNENLNSPVGLPFEMSGMLVACKTSWRDTLMQFLKSRPIVKLYKDPLKNPLNNYVLVEMFVIRFSINATSKTMPAERFISVFCDHDGSFKFCTTVRLFTVFLPRYPDALFMRDGDRDVLDKYIFEVVSILNQVSTCGVHVNYSNLLTKEGCNIYTGDEKNIKERSKKIISSHCNCGNTAFPTKHKKYLDAVGYDESTYRDTAERQLAIINGMLSEVALRNERKPYVLDVYSQLLSQKHVRRPEELDFPATCCIQNGNKITAFEAHKFNKCFRYYFETQGTNEETEKEYYPSLIHKFDLPRPNSPKGYQLSYTDDMKKFLLLCSKGEVRPHYLNSDPRKS